MAGNASRLVCPVTRAKMDSTEEPQKKVFKARKTMRVSDRQQLEAVYKVKEELLKTTEVKLLNGKHENGDSDMNSLLSNTDCAEVKKEINGMVDLCVNSEEGRAACDEMSETKSPESRAGNTVNDIESKPLMPSSENVTPEQAKDTDIAVKCEAENGVGSSKDNFHEENNRKDQVDQRKNDIPLEGENKPVCDISDSSEQKGETNYLPVNSSSSGTGEEKRTEEVTVEEVVGEAAISSSMEADQEKQEGSTGPETTVSKTVDEPSESTLDNTDCMETDDIIPILEKLAPAEDDLSCFSKSSLLPVDDTLPDLEEKIDNCLGSPSKQESNESLPKEAFLVLSDEDDPCDEKEELAEGILPNKSSLPEEVEGERKKECEDKEGEEAHKEEEKQIEKSEASKRKRSKSEDMDSIHSKHRRYMGEDYEAELQVKITARKDVDLKLQKIIQRLLEEKLTALQCAVFDKTLADLKTRMEKVECNKRHKTVLTEMQAKIARLTKRVGAAKEDLKKRQENVANAPVSPGKAAPETANVNNATYRNAGTVRQMLESKRNVGESTPSTFQAPANPVGTPGLYNATASRAPLQMKIPLPACSSTAPAEPPTIAAPKTENQTSRPPTDTAANKRPAEGTAQLSDHKVARCVPYTCGIFDGTTSINCFEKQLKQEETPSENKEAVEAAQTNFNFPEDVLFGLEEEEEDARSIKNTHKQTGWAANLLKQWLAKNGKDPSFELVPVSELNDILREFYYTIRNHDGNTYSVASYKSMRAGLNRHLKMPPYNRQICLMKDKEFSSANMVFVSVLKMLRMQGKDETHHHPPIAAEDLRRIKQSGVLGLHSPLALVNKVWFDLQLHFAKRGREILRDLAPDAFVVEKDKNGRRYAMFRYPGKGKNGEDPHKMGKMYDMPGDPNCPVFSLELYLSKLPPEPPAFYLHPLKLTSEQMQEQPVWYKREPMGVNYLGTMMPRISVAARLSQRYTNHSLRTTTIQLLCEAGLGPREIMAVTGHRSESAIRHYWGPAEVRYRAWSDRMENNASNYRYRKIPNEVIKESVSGASNSSVKRTVLEQNKILFPTKSVVLPGTNSVALGPEGHPALNCKSPVLLNRSTSKVFLPKSMTSGNLTAGPLQGCCSKPVFIKRVIKQEPMT
ncbi:activating transcription factor 7-interacting protein 1 isoform X5 [Pyrgilauda ruficollis]|uniref:activating transcription factor 7-interacting protein 1 isoform X5 n=1 Tax=Pyrgilauda ruficollis TaxID=221976 RepID=UPI001B88561B|nr:activating transcription factor 7-interacting protein 1 isoform X5 [Pyrgilauda ruficollis]